MFILQHFRVWIVETRTYNAPLSQHALKGVPGGTSTYVNFGLSAKLPTAILVSWFSFRLSSLRTQATRSQQIAHASTWGDMQVFTHSHTYLKPLTGTWTYAHACVFMYMCDYCYGLKTRQHARGYTSLTQCHIRVMTEHVGESGTEYLPQ